MALCRIIHSILHSRLHNRYTTDYIPYYTTGRGQHPALFCFGNVGKCWHNVFPGVLAVLCNMTQRNPRKNLIKPNKKYFSKPAAGNGTFLLSAEPLPNCRKHRRGLGWQHFHKNIVAKYYYKYCNSIVNLSKVCYNADRKLNNEHQTKQNTFTEKG